MWIIGLIVGVIGLLIFIEGAFPIDDALGSWVFSGFCLMIIGAVMVVMSGGLSFAQEHPNQNPQKGWVTVNHSNSKLHKICDGTTLLYDNHTKTDNSPECQSIKK